VIGHVRAGEDHFVAAQRGRIVAAPVVVEKGNLHNASKDHNTATIVADMLRLVKHMVGILQQQARNLEDAASPLLIFVSYRDLLH
jgi:hypothetical protein